MKKYLQSFTCGVALTATTAENTSVTTQTIKQAIVNCTMLSTYYFGDGNDSMKG